MFNVLLALFLLSFAIQPILAQTQLTTLLYNFTLAAVNTTLPNDNSTGVPLVLGQDGATSGLVPHVTSTYASYPYNDFPSLALVDSSLRAYGKFGEWMTNATAIQSGGTMGWITTIRYAQPGAQDFSVVEVPEEEFPLLAAHGVTNLWSLCPSSGFRGQDNVVFNSSANIPPPPYLGYDPTNCYNVKIHILTLQWYVPFLTAIFNELNISQIVYK